MLTIGIAILLILIYRTGIENIQSALTSADPFYLILALIVSAFILGTKLLRWTFLYQSLSRKNAVNIYLFGVGINLIAPIGTGDVARAFAAKKQFGVSASKTIAATIVERIVDTTFLMIMTLFFFLLVVQEEDSIYFSVIPIVLLILAYILLFSKKFIYRIAMLFERLFEKEEGFFNKLTNKMSMSLMTLKKAIDDYAVRKSIVGLTVVLTIVSWAIEAASIYLLLYAFGETVSFLFLVGVVSASWIVGAFSFIPGGMGAKEGSFAFFLELADVPLNIATTVALIDRINNILTSSVGFLYSTVFLSLKPSDLRNENIENIENIKLDMEITALQQGVKK